jgi:hemoglobin
VLRTGPDLQPNAGKVLKDSTINHFFSGMNMKMMHKKQKAFLTMALGGPRDYNGRSMSVAHRKLMKERELNDAHFDAVAVHLQATLQELGVPKEDVATVMDAVGGMRDEVLCRGKWA